MTWACPPGRRPAPSVISFVPSEALPQYDEVPQDRIPYRLNAPESTGQPRPEDGPRTVSRENATQAPIGPAVASPEELARRERVKALVSCLPQEVVELIAAYLDPATAACLKLTSKHFCSILSHSLFTILDEPDNQDLKTIFLHRALDQSLPGHLLCTNCVQYHRRVSVGLETLGTHHDHVANPVFNCPTLLTLPTPRLILTPSKRLPFTLPQLVARSDRIGPAHGIAVSAITRTYSDKAAGFDATDDAAQNWAHNVSLVPHHGHVLLRVESIHPTPSRALTASETNRLLISRDQYAPYFSTCQHYTHGGTLIDLAKCALSHHQDEVVKEAARKPIAGVKGSMASVGSRVPSLCAECRPIRACDDCGTEYHITLRLAEDRAHRARRRSYAARNSLAAPAEPPKFITHLCVTRYSDLGACEHADDPAWRAVAGDAGERENDIRFLCHEFDKMRLKSLKGTWEMATGVGAGGGGKPVSLARKIEWVKAHFKEMEIERTRVRAKIGRR